jgi:hypothetical protein
MDSIVAIVASALGIWCAAMLYGAVTSRTESRALRRATAMMSLGLAFVVAIAVGLLGMFVGVEVPFVETARYLVIGIGAVVLMDVVYFGRDPESKVTEHPTREAT